MRADLHECRLSGRKPSGFIEGKGDHIDSRMCIEGGKGGHMSDVPPGHEFRTLFSGRSVQACRCALI
jgi:hypothetical protein